MAPARFRPASANPPNGAGLRGRLEQFGLATVLSFLDLERRSGEILVVGRDRVGRVWLREGQPLSARIAGSRRVNRTAIYEMLSWDSGWFAFNKEDLASAEDEIEAPTALLLMEAARRSDEAAGAPAY
jgi:two-component system, OmpR family, response regulator